MVFALQLHATNFALQQAFRCMGWKNFNVCGNMERFV